VLLRDLLDLVVWEEYECSPPIEAFLVALVAPQADAAVRELAVITRELEAAGLGHAARQARSPRARRQTEPSRLSGDRSDRRGLPALTPVGAPRNHRDEDNPAECWHDLLGAPPSAAGDENGAGIVSVLGGGCRHPHDAADTPKEI
jgi:hypothetical protein